HRMPRPHVGWFAEHQPQLFGYALRTNACKILCMPEKGVSSFCLDLKPKARSKSYCPQHAKMILLKPLIRIPDRAENLRSQVFLSPDVIDHLLFDRIEKHPVNREIATLR